MCDEQKKRPLRRFLQTLEKRVEGGAFQIVGWSSGSMRSIQLYGERRQPRALRFRELRPQRCNLFAADCGLECCDEWRAPANVVNAKQQLAAQYRAAEITAEIKPYIDDMAVMYGWCDLIICRSGAITVAELAAAGVASILIPLPWFVAEEQRAKYLAFHDHLTELPNRSFFHHRLSDLLDADTAPPGSLAVLFLDLDGFKPINDAHGHAAGDELLRIVAARLARMLRSEDTVCRLGGDEFACLLAGLESRDQAARLAAKLRDAIQAPCKIGHHIVSVGVSIGIALYPTDGNGTKDLLLKADRAMYCAKRERKGVAFYDIALND